ncbi:WD40 repeat-containing protein, putative [Bodo saltans]|uniref:WD40 repeat-containing protein, putative n=1 Tax=Bodo saltans TaxID=75058 RepID=A0A0S4J2D3_BODSA|nr:WD40 repeat-containing protein, putative [Bodo saltans]|eukprot:CUG84647.1 WD40 repeat-containing protein, putative [Bodo saltans]
MPPPPPAGRDIDATIVELPPSAFDHVRFSRAADPPKPDEADVEIEEMVTDDVGKHFGSVKPWIGNAQPPSWWDASTLKQGTPDASLDLDFVYGYRTRQARANVHWVDEPTTFVYHAASVCVVTNIITREQKHFMGHTDDVLCLDYNPKTRLAVSGGVGAHETAPLIVWSVDDMTTKQRISGFLQYGVTCVCFSSDGTRVFGIGDDTNHTVAMYDVGTGTLLGSGAGDRNKIVHAIADTTIGRDSKRNIITIGVSHIKFWDKRPKEDLLIGKKAIGGDIAKQTMVSACCTVQFAIVGNVAGAFYIFDDGILVRTVEGHTSYCGALFASHNTVYSGGRDGLLKQWNFELRSGGEVASWSLDEHSVASNSSVVLNGTRTRRHNGCRAISVMNDKIVVGTGLGSIYCILDGKEITPILETHFEETGGSLAELWGLDVHPTEPLFCSSAEDCTLRLWSMDLGSMILMTNIAYGSRCCGFSWDGQMIAVGHENGAFSIWDAMTLVPLLPFTRKREARTNAIAFSPDGRFLAMSLGTPARCVDVYYVRRDRGDLRLDYIGCCDISSQILQIDWSLDSSLLQCCTTNYENVRFNIPGCDPNMLYDGYDEVWATHSGVIGWGVQGIWEDCSDGTDVNSCGRSRSGKYLVAGYDSTRVRLFNFPCIPKTHEQSTKVVFPKHREYIGHSSHVTRVLWSADDRYVVSSGGMDLTILRWKVHHGKKSSTEELKPYTEPCRDAVAQDVANGVIRELKTTANKRIFVEEQSQATAMTSTRGGTPPPYGAGMDVAGTTTRHGALLPDNQQPARSITGLRRAVSASAPKSRLHQTTNTMRMKQEIAKQHREHLERIQNNHRRFQ